MMERTNRFRAAATLAFIACLFAAACGDGGTTPKQARKRIEARDLSFDDAGLKEAIAKGDTEAVYLFVAAGYDVSAAPAGADAPLQFAVRRANPPAIEALIAGGARAESLGGILNIPATRGDRWAMGVLLDAGAEIDSTDAAKRCALLAAGAAGRLDSVRFLLERGADPDGPPGGDTRGDTPLLEAIRGSDAQLWRALVDAGATVDRPGGRPLVTPLMRAARLGNVAAVEFLLAAGADPGRRIAGTDARSIAAEAGHARIVELLDAASD